MPRLNQRHRKWKIMRRRQAIEKAQNDKRRLLAKNKQNVCKTKPTTPETPGKKYTLMSKSNSFPHEPVPVRLISLVNVKNMLNPLKAVVSSMYCWWLSSIRQGLEVVKDTLYPSRVYLRELNALRQHIEILEMKLTQLREIFNVNLESNNAKAAEICCCRKYVDFSPGPTKIPVWPVQPIVSRAMLLSPVGALPPPPPPPPLPPPSVFLQKPLQIQRKARSEKSLQIVSEEIGRPPSITMKDLLKVKLKKTADRFEITKTERMDGPLSVTVNDLLEVKLRKTQNKLEKPKMDTPGKKRSPLVTISDLQGFNLQAKANQLQKPATKIITLNSPVLDLRKRLKKVDIERSPGGTPLYKENRDTGSGLTPVMTQALRRKFEMARPKSPPCCRSPHTSFDEQNTY
ncbi:proline-rich protein 11 [Heptranchias perlo]|uniref:proline-rich protein 11 n=1 Tax=Heptranchias perlo TaxID=212740 RepID=UPI0035596244